MTEADKARDKQTALAALKNIAAKYWRGEATMGVLVMYIAVAMRFDTTQAEIDKACRENPC